LDALPETGSSEATYALELAWMDLQGQRTETPLLPIRRTVPVSARVTTVKDARLAVTSGASTLKIKIGDASLESEDALIAAVREAVGPDVAIRVDVNGRWSLSEAAVALRQLARHQLEWVEQPVATLEELVQLRSEALIPIAVDESLRSFADLERVITTKAADVVVLKPQYVGGIRAALRMAERAQEAGLTVVVTSALESPVGEQGALFLAATLAETPACGFSQGQDWETQLPRCHGLGVRPAGLEVTPDESFASESAEASALPHPLQSVALASPDQVVLAIEEREWTARELMKAVEHRSRSLEAAGVAPGMRVALLGKPGLEWIQTWHALGWLGVSIAPLSAKASSAELRVAIDVLRPDCIVRLPDAPMVSGVEQVSGVCAPELAPVSERFWAMDEARCVLLTSGTTGTPRAVELTTQQLLLSAFSSAIRLGHQPSDRWLLCLPLHHIAGVSVLMRCAWYGTTVVFQERFDPLQVVASIERGDTTLISLVPTMLSRVLDAWPQDRFPDSLRAILVGGAPTSPELLARCAEQGAPVAVTWGMTEAASQVATRSIGDYDPASGVGTPLPFARVSVSDTGMHVQGPIVGGRLRTGDRGRIDEQGRIHVLGRADDLILSGGENLDPAEIEGALCAHPKIAEAAVVAESHAEWGQRPVAYLVAVADTPSDNELVAHCHRTLSRFKVPDEFRWVSALPRNEMGKLQRSTLGFTTKE